MFGSLLNFRAPPALVTRIDKWAAKQKDEHRDPRPFVACWKRLYLTKMIEMDAVDANTIAAYSAAASALLSLCALGVAIFVPRSAAKLSEELRKQTSAEEEKKRLKLLVFMSIMQERAIPYTAQAVQALNLIDLVFADNQMVKNA